MTVDYLEERARKGDLRAFDRLLGRVPAAPPEKGDELPAAARRSPVALVREPRSRYRTRGKRK